MSRGIRPTSFEPVFAGELGLWVRPQCDDLAIVAEVKRHYSGVPVPTGATVLDLGAHIGAALPIWQASGAAAVVAVEPEPRNAALLRTNATLMTIPIDVIQAAVVGGNFEGESASFGISDGKGQWAHSLLGRKTRHVMVRVVRMPMLMERHRPAVVKCDIEGGELLIPELRYLPGYVTALALEIHYGKPGSDSDRQAADLVASFFSQGFRAMKVTNGPPMNGVWVR